MMDRMIERSTTIRGTYHSNLVFPFKYNTIALLLFHSQYWVIFHQCLTYFFPFFFFFCKYIMCTVVRLYKWNKNQRCLVENEKKLKKEKQQLQHRQNEWAIQISVCNHLSAMPVTNRRFHRTLNLISCNRLSIIRREERQETFTFSSFQCDAMLKDDLFSAIHVP